MRVSDGSIELHAVVSGNSLRVSIALEETAIPYALRLHSLLAEEEGAFASRGPFDPEWQEPVMIERRANDLPGCATGLKSEVLGR
jgi:hypothetical protein